MACVPASAAETPAGDRLDKAILIELPLHSGGTSLGPDLQPRCGPPPPNRRLRRRPHRFACRNRTRRPPSSFRRNRPNPRCASRCRTAAAGHHPRRAAHAGSAPRPARTAARCSGAGHTAVAAMPEPAQPEASPPAARSVVAAIPADVLKQSLQRLAFGRETDRPRGAGRARVL